MKRAIDTEEITLDDVDALINAGKWPRALRIVRTSTFELKHMKEQRYWSLRALAELLIGHANMLSYCQRRAASCPDYVKRIEGDFLRDQTLFLIRARRLTEAATCLNKARPYHRSVDRLAVFTMVSGILAYANGDFDDALQLFENADKLWRMLKIRHEPATDQWVKNNRFHLLKAQAKLGCIDRELVNKIMAEDPSRARRWRARYIREFGKVGNNLDDWAIYATTRIRRNG